MLTPAVAQARARTGGRPFAWCGHGWRDYGLVLTTGVSAGGTGRADGPPAEAAAGLALTQRIKHADPHGRLLSIEVKATIGTRVTPPGTTRIERLNGVLRDRVNALTRKTHAFAKTVDTWDAMLGLAIFEHNWLRPHPALRRPLSGPPAARADASSAAHRPWPSASLTSPGPGPTSSECLRMSRIDGVITQFLPARQFPDRLLVPYAGQMATETSLIQRNGRKR